MVDGNELCVCVYNLVENSTDDGLKKKWMKKKIIKSECRKRCTNNHWKITTANGKSEIMALLPVANTKTITTMIQTTATSTTAASKKWYLGIFADEMKI